MRFYALLLLLAPVLTLTAADTWMRTSDFRAHGLHACDQLAVAWDEQRIAVTIDGGATWSQALMPSRTDQFGVIGALATPIGPLVQLSNGHVVTVNRGAFVPLVGAPLISAMALSGNRQVFFEGVDGTVLRLAGGTTQQVGMGRIYRAVANGVLIQQGGAELSLAGAGPAQGISVKARDLPPAFQLVPLTGPGGDQWVTPDGMLWVLKDGHVVDLNRRAVAMKSYFNGPLGYQEFLVYKEQQQISMQQRSGFQVHVRSNGLPEHCLLVAAATKTFLAVSPDGLWYVPIDHAP